MTRAVVIAEAGVNHNGSLDTAIALIDASADAGADIVKFQTFKSAALATASAGRAEYQVRNLGADGGQRSMLEALELDEAAHLQLVSHCRRRNIKFLSTPFDPGSTDFLIETLGLRLIKVGSGDMTNGPHLLDLARRQVGIILSTGMATMDEIAEALGVIAYGYLGGTTPRRDAFREALADRRGRELLRERVTVLHCTSNYPAATEEIHLAAIDTIRSTFQTEVGFSDHSDSIVIPVAAVARGAVMIEKHLTLDRSMPGPDHRASIEPPLFAEMVRNIRMVENAVGSPAKAPTPGERKTMPVARKSLVAAKRIAVGEPFTEMNLTIKRPGTGLSPNQLWDLLGRPASRFYGADDLIEEMVNDPR